MPRIKLILLGIFFSCGLKSQVFKAIVSKQLVTAGEPFQVQYVLDNIEKDDEFTPPVFKGFRVVSGPYTYNGASDGKSGSAHLKNIVFTLVSPKPGRFVLAGATAKINGRRLKCDDIIIDVMTKQEALEKPEKNNQEGPSDYFLRPGEDPDEKMRKNLFMKVHVDRTTCFIGQPVVATFKLYSRLESKSDIVKNPGFYGFSVQDIANLNDNIARTEIVSGKAFDVHTIRIVQLYPLREGIFTIDPMEVTNKVEFSKSVVNKKPEQEIIEGVVEPKEGADKNIMTYENHMSTEKIAIRVKPYPVAKKPTAFNGATGHFMIVTILEKNELAKNEEGALIVTISGKGNFPQLTPPVVQWPGNIEGFEPVLKDSLDKTQVPLKGSKTFRFPFIGDKPGEYKVPSISLTFFDPDSNIYKTVSSDTAFITISDHEKKVEPTEQQVTIPADKADHKTLWLYGSIFFVVLVIILLQLRKPKKDEPLKEIVVEKSESPISTTELLMPVQFSLVADDGNFYTLLQKSIWEHLGLSGSKMNKDELYKVLKQKNMEEQYHQILTVLEECEAAVFTKAEMMQDKQELLNKARAILVQIKT